MKIEDVKAALEIGRKVWSVPGPKEGLFLYTLLNNPEDSAQILSNALAMLGEQEWIMAGLGCSDPVEATAIAIAVYMTNREQAEDEQKGAQSDDLCLGEEHFVE